MNYDLQIKYLNIDNNSKNQPRFPVVLTPQQNTDLFKEND